MTAIVAALDAAVLAINAGAAALIAVVSGTFAVVTATSAADWGMIPHGMAMIAVALETGVLEWQMKLWNYECPKTVAAKGIENGRLFPKPACQRRRSERGNAAVL
jgi:hypothetical protein